MSQTPGESSLLGDLVTAYRKAKVDLFYDDSPRRLDLEKYERDLGDHLPNLRDLLLSSDEHWVNDPGFLGGYTVIPKFISEPTTPHHTIWSDPARSWEQHWAPQAVQPVADFRLMAECSIDLHVLSTLWLLHVGPTVDARLSRSARGNRLEYRNSGQINELHRGSFKPYHSAYEKWREDGLTAMRNGLEGGRRVIALTADVTQFYHRLNPQFLLHKEFLEETLGIKLTKWQAKLTRLFVSALATWASSVGDVVMRSSPGGLPVGLPASAVVANLALTELDQVVESTRPLFYGRYVDDILLVCADEGDTPTLSELLRKLAAAGGSLLSIIDDKPGEPSLHFHPDYLSDSKIVFDNEKNKVFYLDTKSGHSIIDAIAANIAARKSEWRVVSVLPTSSSEIEPSIAHVTRLNGDPALTLRDAEQISARKQSFSLTIRDFESLERNLPPDSWVDERRAFFDAVQQHILSLPAVFELSTYIARLVSLAASCADKEAILSTIAVLAALPDKVSATCRISLGSSEATESDRENILSRWRSHLGNQAVEGIAAGWKGPMADSLLQDIRRIMSKLEPRHHSIFESAAALSRAHKRLAQRDLARDPYRWSALDLRPGDKVRPATKDFGLPAPRMLRDGLNELANSVGSWHGARLKGRPAGSRDAGFIFATRPPSTTELYQALSNTGNNDYGIADANVVRRICRALRGTPLRSSVRVKRRVDAPEIIDVPTGRHRSPIKVALVMMGTDEQNTLRSACGIPSSDRERFNAIRALLESARSGILASNATSTAKRETDKPDYILLPELAMPREWFDEFARALMRSGISLIAGIEHQPRPGNVVTNQVWASLRTFDRRFFRYVQDKQTPAHIERAMLLDKGLTLKPDFKWKLPPVINHGGFLFATLICSEFTNISYRAHLRGSIDALFVPEWNQDLNSFEALVEASSLDLHAFIAQANTRGFGDTRLRAPAYDVWGRDVVRLKGGEQDYFVVGTIDFEGLRQFQSSPPPSSKSEKPVRPTFKPLPDGFTLDPERR